jgi:hypothetical protein
MGKIAKRGNDKQNITIAGIPPIQQYLMTVVNSLSSISALSFGRYK